MVPGPDETATEGYGAEEAAPEAFEAEAAGEPNGPNKAAGTEVADEEDETDGTEEPDDTDDTDGADDADGADGADGDAPPETAGAMVGGDFTGCAAAMRGEAFTRASNGDDEPRAAAILRGQCRC